MKKRTKKCVFRRRETKPKRAIAIRMTVVSLCLFVAQGSIAQDLRQCVSLVQDLAVQLTNSRSVAQMDRMANSGSLTYQSTVFYLAALDLVQGKCANLAESANGVNFDSVREHVGRAYVDNHLKVHFRCGYGLRDNRQHCVDAIQPTIAKLAEDKIAASEQLFEHLVSTGVWER